MLKFAVVIFIVFCCRVPSTLANKGIPTDNLPTSLPEAGDKSRNTWNSTVRNLTNMLYENCNISSCNPMHYKHCYDDKVPQLVVHGIAVILGLVFAFFGKELNVDINKLFKSRLLWYLSSV